VSLAQQIAWRYFKGKKSAQAINIISWISMGAILVATAAMIILFSVFNGIEGLTKDLYTAFYPDIKIAPVKGKFAQLSEAQLDQIEAHKLVDLYSLTLEDMVMFAGEEQQKIGAIKGVENSWFEINSLPKYMLDGAPMFQEGSAIPPAIVGLRVANALKVEAGNVFATFNIYYPKPGGNYSSIQPSEAFNNITVQPTGIFRVEPAIDERYAIIPLKAARELLQQPLGFSSIDIKLKADVTYAEAKSALAQIVGEDFVVADKYEQNKTLFMILNSEKWAVYAILLLVMLIASFNMIGALSMLVIEKKQDIAILKSMGLTPKKVQQIFLNSGLIMAGIGGLGGLAIGYIICFCQQQFGIVGMGSGFIVDAYPVVFKWVDFVVVIITVVIVGLLASIYPAYKAAKSPTIIKVD